MKTGTITILSVLLLIVMVVPAHAQSTAEFGYQLHPEKLLENTDGTLQIFVVSNDLMVPKSINNLKVTSSDNSVIQVLGIDEDDGGFIKNVNIKAVKPGMASIALAAPGFSSKEIALEVFHNSNHPTQILMKLTPNEFPVDGPKFGYVGIELATTGGLPTKAVEDVTIKINTPNSKVVELVTDKVTIQKGEYYAVSKFNVKGSGDAIIFAESENMKKVSELIHVREPAEPLSVQLFAYPSNFNSYVATNGYVIAELLDAEGIPVKAEEDIYLKLEVENPDASINTSHDYEEVYFDSKELVIKEGDYSAYTKFAPRPDKGDLTASYSVTYNMFVTTQDYVVKGTSITVSNDDYGLLEGEGPATIAPIPFLTTGEKEIVGVTYFSTDIDVIRNVDVIGSQTELVTVTVPVAASEDLELEVASSVLDTVQTENVVMDEGDNVALVFGNTGTLMTEEGVEFYITDGEGIKTAQGIPYGPIEDDLNLKIESLLPKAMVGNNFPAIGYLMETEDGDEEAATTNDDDDEDEDGRIGVTHFVEDAVFSFSANDFIDVDPIIIEQNQEYAFIEPFSKEVGTHMISGQVNQLEGDLTITSHTTDPAIIHLSFSENLLKDTQSLGTVQLLDSSKNPVYAVQDTTIKLVSNDEEVISIPEEINIKKGEYFDVFELNTHNEGIAEIALLSEDLPLANYEINVIDISPQVTLDLLGTLNWNERIEAKLSIAIPEIEVPLDGFNVEWTVEGGEVRQSDTVTNSDGIAIMNVIANQEETVKISAIVEGNGLSSTSISKTAQIKNLPIVETEITAPEPTITEANFLDTNTLIMIIIPVGIGAAIFMLKRMDKLDMITEKLPIGDKIEEIKERISDIRNR